MRHLALPNVRGDKAKAVARMEQYTRDAAAQGAQIILCPEACLDGYSLHDGSYTREQALAFAEDAETGPSIRKLRALTSELQVHLCIGFPEREAGKLYNTAQLIGPAGQIVGKYRKTHVHCYMFTYNSARCVLKAMFPLITGRAPARWLAATQPHTA